MIMDERTEFADNVSVAAGTGTAVIGDVIDLGVDGRDIGNGQELYLVIKTGATEIITGGAAGEISFDLVSDSTANLPHLDIRDRLPRDRESHHCDKVATALDVSRAAVRAPA